ncbi:MAG: hypothetical protein VZS44_12000, partial [Bacilli bacterium]|nr:hypothetical protein [Bacilli bacterium]
PLINVINLDRLVQNLPFLCYNFNDFKKELIQMNEEKGFNKTVINCLSMIYLTPLTNPYKIRKN